MVNLGERWVGGTCTRVVPQHVHRSVSSNNLDDMESTELLREIIPRNKTITTLNLSKIEFGRTDGAFECIVDGLISNSTLLKVDLSDCTLGDSGVSFLAQALGLRNTALQILSLVGNFITSMGVGVLLETMEHCSLAADVDLHRNSIGNEGATILARYLGANALPNLTRLSLFHCGIGDDGFIALMSALEQNTSLLHLDFRYANDIGERAFFVLAESLPEIKVLQRVDLP